MAINMTRPPLDENTRRVFQAIRTKRRVAELAKQHEEIQKQRRKRLGAILWNGQQPTAAFKAGLEVPEPIPRFVGTEEEHLDTLWAVFDDDIYPIVEGFVADSDATTQFWVYDLDRATRIGQFFVPSGRRPRLANVCQHGIQLRLF